MSTNSVEIIFLGCSAVGKTLVSRQIVNGAASKRVTEKNTESFEPNHFPTGLKQPTVNPMTTPTTGMQYEKLSLNGREVVLREVGFDMARLWHKYYKKADILLYVVDTANRPQLAAASIELYRILENPVVHEKPLIILFNKIDQALHMDPIFLNQYIHVTELRAHHGVCKWRFKIFDYTIINGC